MERMDVFSLKWCVYMLASFAVVGHIKNGNFIIGNRKKTSME